MLPSGATVKTQIHVSTTAASKITMDDLNIPAKEKYGAQPPIELLRQYLDHGGWYDYAHVKQGFRAIRGVQLIAAMCPPGGGRNDITPRLLRHLTVLAVSPFSAQTMCGIYDTILEWFFRSQGFSSAVTDSRHQDSDNGVSCGRNYDRCFVRTCRIRWVWI